MRIFIFNIRLDTSVYCFSGVISILTVSKCPVVCRLKLKHRTHANNVHTLYAVVVLFTIALGINRTHVRAGDQTVIVAHTFSGLTDNLGVMREFCCCYCNNGTGDKGAARSPHFTS